MQQVFTSLYRNTLASSVYLPAQLEIKEDTFKNLLLNLDKKFMCLLLFQKSMVKVCADNADQKWRNLLSGREVRPITCVGDKSFVLHFSCIALRKNFIDGFNVS